MPPLRFTGPHRAVTEQAQKSGCSRQCVYNHARQVMAAVEAEHSGGPTREELIRDNEALRRENAQLWDWLFQTIEFPLVKQQEFAVTALAMGLSLNQLGVLLAILLGTQACPSRSTLHRWVQAAATAAGRILKQLDRSCQAFVLVGCLDEIFFHRRPVLVGVEPHSMVWFVGKKADNCQGATWFGELKPWSSLRSVVCDAGSGLQAGIAQFQQDRRGSQSESASLEKTLDVFHTKQEAQRVLRTMWNRVERLWEQAEAATRAVEQAQRQGRDARGLAVTARAAWKKASAAFQRYEQAETGWKRAEPALSLFRPDGLVNDRSWRKSRSRWPCRCCQAPNGPRSVGCSKRRSRSPSWISSTISSANFRCPRSCVPLWCVCGGCGGSGPGIRTRLRWGVIARWPRWCSRSSARRSTRTGASSTGRWRRCSVERCAPAVRWSA